MKGASSHPVNSVRPADAIGEQLHTPTHRALQIYAFDPSLDLELELVRLNRSVVNVAWEEALKRGPVGEYLEVVDVDPASDCVYEPVDLNHPHLLAQDGLAPSEGNPQFHQQMVYAVAMKTIGAFERALGRTVHWSPRLRDENGNWLSWSESYVPRLRIYPHALREANAYYSSQKKALLFGYFNAQNTDAREGFPGGVVFSCLSHDVIAHETTHAILDGIHRRMLEVTNPDVLAFHEAFADLVAIFQHFTLPGVLENQIAQTRGDLQAENLLAKLAVQFGRATKRGNALRDALGSPNPQTGQWERRKADPRRIHQVSEPHARGAILVAAVFDAFLTIYQSHTADLLRIATGGTGKLPKGDLPPDLVARLADEASKVAQRMLNICIRALDYLPPVDVTFGDYVRALVTADHDLVPDDTRHYRIAIIGGFRDRGIYPHDVRTLSVESLRWRRPDDREQRLLQALLPPVGVLRVMADAQDFAHGDLSALTDRDAKAAIGGHGQFIDIEEVSNCLVQAYRQTGRTKAVAQPGQTGPADAIVDESPRRRDEHLRTRQFAWFLHECLYTQARNVIPEDHREDVTKALGIDLFDDDLKFEVHAVRPVTRVRPDGRTKTDLLLLITQRVKRELRMAKEPGDQSAFHYRFRGGCTLLIDPAIGEVRYVISKNIRSEGRRTRQEQFLKDRLEREGLHVQGRYGVWQSGEPTAPQEPFRLLHRGELEEHY